jgi:hypothetical protein
MRGDAMSVRLAAACALLALGSRVAPAQSAADGTLLGARSLAPDAALKVWVPEGRIRLVAWDRDSIVVRGHVARSDHFFLSGDRAGVKLGVDGAATGAGPAELAAWIPRRAMLSVKTVGASIDGSGVSGWFYTVSGAIHLDGAATSLEVESMAGPLDLDATTPWLRARTGRGHLLLRGAPQSVDASTISGTLDVAATSTLRGQLGSVSGDIHWVGAPPDGAIIELSSHAGNVELLLPPAVSADFTLSTISGVIENEFATARRTAADPRSLRLTLGRGGAQLSVRTFRGAIRLRRR